MPNKNNTSEYPMHVIGKISSYFLSNLAAQNKLPDEIINKNTILTNIYLTSFFKNTIQTLILPAAAARLLHLHSLSRENSLSHLPKTYPQTVQQIVH